jgi:hypothetical protein
VELDGCHGGWRTRTLSQGARRRSDANGRTLLCLLSIAYTNCRSPAS